MQTTCLASLATRAVLRRPMLAIKLDPKKPGIFGCAGQSLALLETL